MPLPAFAASLLTNAGVGAGLGLLTTAIADLLSGGRAPTPDAAERVLEAQRAIVEDLERQGVPRARAEGIARAQTAKLLLEHAGADPVTAQEYLTGALGGAVGGALLGAAAQAVPAALARMRRPGSSAAPAKPPSTRGRSAGRKASESTPKSSADRKASDSAPKSSADSSAKSGADSAPSGGRSAVDADAPGAGAPAAPRAADAPATTTPSPPPTQRAGGARQQDDELLTAMIKMQDERPLSPRETELVRKAAEDPAMAVFMGLSDGDPGGFSEPLESFLTPPKAKPKARPKAKPKAEPKAKRAPRKQPPQPPQP